MSTEDEFTKAKATIEDLKSALAASLTDNETLQAQNDALQEERTKANRVSQETANFNSLLHDKAQRLEIDNKELGTQNAFLRERVEQKDKMIADLMKRIQIMKSTEKPTPLPIGPAI